ncbi:LOW QUALITY PROTEIN: zinc finger CCCH domain-containing protein 6-like [Coregonus clupeaformis]|uniref:LOW QUALITY PROTEIN: zinc finger CCCH domain-containing protein 6-like n=1 Tax=Coregonus clupeaformis TaxID=59861 RepID=UPI001E1C2621|nr:LOW QUALITY PROTEIN: zinc finger CCCH domain-containing protein 6-like [Coregonus clupeaformis]
MRKARKRKAMKRETRNARNRKARKRKNRKRKDKKAKKRKYRKRKARKRKGQEGKEEKGQEEKKGQEEEGLEGRSGHGNPQKSERPPGRHRSASGDYDKYSDYSEDKYDYEGEGDDYDVEEMWQVKDSTSPGQGLGQMKYICKYFLEGRCIKGDQCMFKHELVTLDKKKELCKFNLQGYCLKGDNCIYIHSEYPWKLFHTGAKCYQGDNCKLFHDPLNDVTKDLLDKIINTEEEIAHDDEMELEDLRKQGIVPLPKPPPGVGLLPTLGPGGPGSGGPNPGPCPGPSSPQEGGSSGGNSGGRNIPSLFEIVVKPMVDLSQKMAQSGSNFNSQSRDQFQGDEFGGGGPNDNMQQSGPNSPPPVPPPGSPPGSMGGPSPPYPSHTGPPMQQQQSPPGQHLQQQPPHGFPIPPPPGPPPPFLGHRPNMNPNMNMNSNMNMDLQRPPPPFPPFPDPMEMLQNMNTPFQAMGVLQQLLQEPVGDKPFSQNTSQQQGSAVSQMLSQMQDLPPCSTVPEAGPTPMQYSPRCRTYPLQYSPRCRTYPLQYSPRSRTYPHAVQSQMQDLPPAVQSQMQDLPPAVQSQMQDLPPAVQSQMQDLPPAVQSQMQDLPPAVQSQMQDLPPAVQSQMQDLPPAVQKALFLHQQQQLQQGSDPQGFEEQGGKNPKSNSSDDEDGDRVTAILKCLKKQNEKDQQGPQSTKPPSGQVAPGDPCLQKKRAPPSDPRMKAADPRQRPPDNMRKEPNSSGDPRQALYPRKVRLQEPHSSFKPQLLQLHHHHQQQQHKASAREEDGERAALIPLDPCPGVTLREPCCQLQQFSHIHLDIVLQCPAYASTVVWSAEDLIPSLVPKQEHSINLPLPPLIADAQMNQTNNRTRMISPDHTSSNTTTPPHMDPRLVAVRLKEGLVGVGVGLGRLPSRTLEPRGSTERLLDSRQHKALGQDPRIGWSGTLDSKVPILRETEGGGAEGDPRLQRSSASSSSSSKTTTLTLSAPSKPEAEKLCPYAPGRLSSSGGGLESPTTSTLLGGISLYDPRNQAPQLGQRDETEPPDSTFIIIFALANPPVWRSISTQEDRGGTESTMNGSESNSPNPTLSSAPTVMTSGSEPPSSPVKPSAPAVHHLPIQALAGLIRPPYTDPRQAKQVEKESKHEEEKMEEEEAKEQETEDDRLLKEVFKTFDPTASPFSQ